MDDLERDPLIGNQQADFLQAEDNPAEVLKMLPAQDRREKPLSGVAAAREKDPREVLTSMRRRERPGGRAKAEVISAIPGESVHSEEADVSEEIAQEREKLRKKFEKRGIILPEDHEFTRLVTSICEKIGAGDKEVLVIDDEEFNAAFYPNAETIVMSRGMCRKFLEMGLDLKEDHLAAVAYHEITHSEGESERSNHAEEYRADLGGMRKLAAAGYNPHAMIEWQQVFPYLHGRGGESHPEIIERMRNLEEQLADDEHPFAHTSKAETQLSEELLEWFRGDSSVYDRTERLLHASPAEIAAALAETTTQQEFWELYMLYQHAEKVAKVKRALDVHGEAYTQFAKKCCVTLRTAKSSRSKYTNL